MSAADPAVPDKLAAPLGASTVLGELLARVPAGVPVALVGPERPGSSPAVPGPEVLTTPLSGPLLLRVREEPPGGGPAAAVAAGVAGLGAAGHLAPRGPADVVVVCAGDAPWSALAVPALLAALRAAGPGVGAAVAVDAAGVRQPLLAAHRVAALVERLRGAGDLAGRPAGWLLGAGAVAVPLPPDAAGAAEDIDTPGQLARARERAAGGG